MTSRESIGLDSIYHAWGIGDLEHFNESERVTSEGEQRSSRQRKKPDHGWREAMLTLDQPRIAHLPEATVAEVEGNPGLAPWSGWGA